MNKKLVAGVATAAVLLLAAYFGWKYLQNDQPGPPPATGTVTEVHLDNWKSEVTDQQSQTPVLVYFTRTGVPDEQSQTVADFAAANGGKVKVVRLNCDQRELLVLASKYDVADFPAFRLLYKNAAYKADGQDGKVSSLDDLRKLLSQAATP